MEAKENCKSSAAYPMNSGDGPYSYAKTSTFQKTVIHFTKELVQKEVVEKLDIGFSSTASPPTIFSIADLGCSVGPNTFSAVESIIEAVELKLQSQGLTSKIPEFQVLFNDHASNDFNMLFKSLPSNRRYYAAGVPGSFYGRLFPEASLHFIHSSFALHWLSRVPKAVTDKSSPAWNKGRVYYSNSRDEVIEAYKAQYQKDMEDFLQARAKEVVCGGFMVFIIMGIANGIHPSEAGGIVSEETVDSFNIPIYMTTPHEFETAVKRNGCFSVERMEVLPHEKVNGVANNDHQIITYPMRSALTGLIKQEIGEEIVDELFDLYLKKVEEVYLSSILDSGKSLSFLVVLKRKASH
ncbi:putative S-adenosylmethionine-dependent methyltransferase [Morus notabilis]|uniref:Putative S-adenosylmethionine-dependent methyltransferase n=1 Tax=Morus notabilis TaxID=981085 RepID=W9QP06_9ROSA|nr:putative S-adenosylmethionine-dependent methyltransferase [Morus notabilis]